MAIRVDRIRADIAAIGAITQTPGKGSTRPTFSAEWGRARDYVIDEARKIDCVAKIDAAGNVFIKPARVGPDQKTWLCGSHVDTVPHGGDFDGVAGVVAALELLRSARDDGITLSLELVIFAEEEGPTFGLGMLGSRAMVGELDASRFGELKNKEGQSYLEAGAPYGVIADAIASAEIDPNNYLGLIELHIEQGPGLWRRDQRLAVVTAIAGRRQYRVVVTGDANHAGATAMTDRKDALAGAAEIVLSLEALAPLLSNETVVTVGRLSVEPNAVNVIADRVTFTIDFRAPDDDVLSRGDSMIRDRLVGITTQRGLKVDFQQTESIPARPMAPRLVAALASAAKLLGKGDVPVAVSGALHDSAVLAPYVPTVMLFVPSQDGISHNPAEFSRVEDVADAARVIEHLVRRPTLAAMDADAFLRVAGPAYEHSPWIAQRAATKLPFASFDALTQAMSDVVGKATRDEQLSLINAHPDLVGKLARENKLTKESTTEQAAAGLTALTANEVAQFETHNAAYRARFGFPFIICARQNKKDAILSAFPVRLSNTIDQEIATALAEIDKIAELRLRDAIWE